LATLKVEFYQKRIGNIEMHAENLAGLEPHRLKGNSRNFGVAEVTVFERAIFEAGPLKIQIRKVTSYERAGVVLANLKIS